MYNILYNNRKLAQIVTAANLSLWSQKYMCVPHCRKLNLCPSSNTNRLIFHVEITAILENDAKFRHTFRGDTAEFFMIRWTVHLLLALHYAVMFSVCCSQWRRRSCTLMLSKKKTRPGGWLEVSVSLCTHCKTAVPTYCGSFPTLWRGSPGREWPEHSI
jgi:hypothetical protein